MCLCARVRNCLRLRIRLGGGWVGGWVECWCVPLHFSVVNSFLSVGHQVVERFSKVFEKCLLRLLRLCVDSSSALLPEGIQSCSYRASVVT